MITSFLLVGNGANYRAYGTGKFDAKLRGLKTIKGQREGKVIIEFKNGNKIVCTTPEMRIERLFSDRRLNYVRSCTFTDEANRLTAEVEFNTEYEDAGTFRKFWNNLKELFTGSKKDKNPSDFFNVTVYSYEMKNGEMKKEAICKGGGSWLSYLQIDDELLWKITDPIQLPWASPQNKLPSDSKFREDSRFIGIRDYENAQQEKDKLDAGQKQDMKLRENFHKNKKKG